MARQFALLRLPNASTSELAVGITEKKRLYYLGVSYEGVYWGCIGIMENEMETIISALHLLVVIRGNAVEDGHYSLEL